MDQKHDTNSHTTTFTTRTTTVQKAQKKLYTHQSVSGVNNSADCDRCTRVIKLGIFHCYPETMCLSLGIHKTSCLTGCGEDIEF